MRHVISTVLFVAAFAAVATYTGVAQQNQMSFFVSSAGVGNGANLGGLAGADKQCQTLAAAAGAGGRMWRAYLSAAAANGQPAVNARDRIGKGPWYNQKGVMIAKSVDDLHSDANNLKKDTALTEKGGVVNGVGDTPNQHDILTGSQLDGTLQPADATPPAVTGPPRRTAADRRSSDTSIAWAAAPPARRGTRRTRRAAARSPIWWRPAATAICTASPAN